MAQQLTPGGAARPRAKRVQKDYDAENFSIAKAALANPSKFPHLADWAPLVLKRLGSKQRSLDLRESIN